MTTAIKTESIIDRQLPHDHNAECGTLGSLFLIPDYLADVSRMIEPEDFYDDANGRIFSAMLALRSVNKPISALVMGAYLKSIGEWEAVGSSAYLSRISNYVPNAAHVIYYADIVAEKSLARKVIRSCTALLADAYDSADAHGLVRQMQSDAHSLAESKTKDTSKPVLLSQAADEVATLLENQERLDATNRAYWGLVSVDDRLGPIMPGEVCVVAARPGMGKTAWGFQMLRHSAEQGRPALLVSLEMDNSELASRDLARLTDIDGRKFRKGEISDTQRREVREAQRGIGDLPLWLWSPATATLPEIRGVIEREIDRHGVRLVAIDYLSLIEVEKAERRNQRHEQVASISRGLKRMAKALKIPLVVLQQLNREADGSEPGLKHLRESGAVEQDADLVMFIHHGMIDKKPMPENERMLLVAKFRAGPTGRVTVGWDRTRTEFTERPVANNPGYEPQFDAYNNRDDSYQREAF